MRGRRKSDQSQLQLTKLNQKKLKYDEFDQNRIKNNESGVHQQFAFESAKNSETSNDNNNLGRNSQMQCESFENFFENSNSVLQLTQQKNSGVETLLENPKQTKKKGTKANDYFQEILNQENTIKKCYFPQKISDKHSENHQDHDQQDQLLIESKNEFSCQKLVEELRNQQQSKLKTLNVIINQLEFTYIPDKVNFREKEINIILEFIDNCIKRKKINRNLLISGKPGCGKTLSINSIIEQLKRDKKKKIQIVFKNIMSYNNTKQLFEEIYKDVVQIIGKKEKIFFENEERISEIKHLISHSNFPQVVFVIDEIDSIFQKNQNCKEIFEIFNISNQENSKICLIGISNTMDLIFKLSEKHKIEMSSVNNLVYEPYDLEDLNEILKLRVFSEEQEDWSPIFDLNTIKLCASKIYNKNNADVRSVFKLCRKTLNCKIEKLEAFLNDQIKSVQSHYKEHDNSNTDSENCQQRYYEDFLKEFTQELNKISKVQIPDLLQSYNEMFQNNKCKEIQDLSEGHQLFLIAIYKCLQKQDFQNVLVQDVYNTFNKISQQILLQKSDYQTIEMIINVFKSYELIDLKACQKKKQKNLNGLNPMDEIIVKIQKDVIYNNLSKNELFEELF